MTTHINAEILSVHCPLGCPSNPSGNDLLFGHVYALSNNPTTKFADWVAYEVDVLNFGDSPGRKWRADPLLDDSETLEAADYKGANRSNLQADRGHQAPLASFAATQYRQSIYVITGPLYDGGDLQLPNADEPHKVPSAYFKIIYDNKGNATAFKMNQTSARNDSYCAMRKTVDEMKQILLFSIPALKNSAEMTARLGC